MAVPRSITERTVFIDSSAYLAILDRRDAYHDEAVEVLQALSLRHFRQVVTNTVAIESHTRILSTLGIVQAAGFLRGLDASNTVVIRSRAADETRAKQIIYQYQDKDFSFVDAISFALMERLGIRRVFTFDRPFAQFGFSPVSISTLGDADSRTR